MTQRCATACCRLRFGSRRGGLRWRWLGFRRRRRNQSNLFHNIEPRAPNQSRDYRTGEPRRIVFHAHCLRFAVEGELPEAVNLARPSQRKQHSLSGLSGIAEHDINVGHGFMIAAGARNNLCSTPVE